MSAREDVNRLMGLFAEMMEALGEHRKSIEALEVENAELAETNAKLLARVHQLTEEGK